MKTIIKIGYRNLKVFFKESILVAVSIALTVSMMSLVVSSMLGVFEAVKEDVIKEPRKSIEIYNVTNPRKILEQIGIEHIAGYEIYGFDNQYTIEEETYAMGISSDLFVLSDEVPASWIESKTIIEGRKSEGPLELVVSKNSKRPIGDKVKISKSTGYENEVVYGTVVGKNNVESSDSYYSYISPEEYMKAGGTGTLGIIFSQGKKDLKALVDPVIKKAVSEGNIDPNHSIIDSNVWYNDDYNYFMGFQSKPSVLVYVFVILAVFLVAMVSLATFTLILNAFSMFLAQRYQVLGTLRSVGSTKKQLSALIILEGLLLTTAGIGFGLVIGYGLSAVLLGLVNTTVENITRFENTFPKFILKPSFPIWSQLLILVSGYLIILIALISISRELFKKSALETLRLGDLKKTNTVYRVKKNPIKSLAYIQSKMTRNYRGIKIALVISTALLFFISSWSSTLFNTIDKNFEKYDTRISVYQTKVKDNPIQTMYDDLDMMNKALKSNGEIIDSIRYVSSSPYEVKAALNYTKDYEEFLIQQRGEHYDFSQEKKEFFENMNFSIVAISDEKYTKLASEQSINNTELHSAILAEKTVPYYVEESVKVFGGNKIHLEANTKLRLEGLDNPKEHNFELTINPLSKELGSDIEVLKSYSDDTILIVSDSTFQELARKDVLEIRALSSTIYLETELTTEQLKNLEKTVEDYGGENYFYLSSDVLQLAIQRQVKKGTDTATLLLFMYISLTVTVNIISVALTNFQMRRKEIASLRSVGATKNQIIQMFAYETLYTMGTTWIIGVVIGNIIGYGLYKLFDIMLPYMFYQRPFMIDIKMVAISFGFVVLLMFVQLVSIIQESKKQNIIEDLRRIS